MLKIEEYIQLIVEPVTRTRFGIEMEHCEYFVKLTSSSTAYVQLKIPYARSHILLNLMFYKWCLHLAPEMYIETDSELPDTELQGIIMKIPCVENWNPYRSDCLVTLITEFIAIYTKYQLTLLKKYPNELHKELEQILQYINEVNIENFVKNSTISKSRMLFKFSIDKEFDALDNNFYQHEYLLAIQVDGVNLDNIQSVELFSPANTKCTGYSLDCLRLPQFDFSLSKYLSSVYEHLSNQLDFIIYSIEVRKNFIATLLTFHRSSVIEYDAKDFSFAVVHLQIGQYMFVLKFTLPVGFPSKRFSVHNYNIYYLSETGTAIKEIENFPYKTEWPSKKKIEMFYKYFIEDEVKKFDQQYQQIQTIANQNK